MERALDGLAAAPGNAVGRARVLAVTDAVDRTPIRRNRRQGEVAAARHALDLAAGEIETIAATLRRGGQAEEAEIVETGVLIARDPSLRREIQAAVVDRGVPAAAAILDATEAQAHAGRGDRRRPPRRASGRHPKRRPSSGGTGRRRLSAATPTGR